MKKVMYFGYGRKNFGYDKELGHDLEVDLKEIDGAGIAIVKGKHLDVFPTQLNLTISNNGDHRTLLRVEKKFSNDVKTGFHILSPQSSENTIVCFDNNELKNINELVVAILKEDNPGIDNASISLNIN